MGSLSSAYTVTSLAFSRRAVVWPPAPNVMSRNRCWVKKTNTFTLEHYELIVDLKLLLLISPIVWRKTYPSISSQCFLGTIFLFHAELQSCQRGCDLTPQCSFQNERTTIWNSQLQVYALPISLHCEFREKPLLWLLCLDLSSWWVQTLYDMGLQHIWFVRMCLKGRLMYCVSIQKRHYHSFIPQIKVWWQHGNTDALTRTNWTSTLNGRRRTTNFRFTVQGQNYVFRSPRQLKPSPAGLSSLPSLHGQLDAEQHRNTHLTSNPNSMADVTYSRGVSYTFW